MSAPDQSAWGNRLNGAAGGEGPPAAALRTINGKETWAEIVDLEAIVRLTRLGFVVAFFAQLVYLAVNYIELDPRVMRATAWYDVFIIAASIIAISVTFAPVFIDHWRMVTLGLCLSLLSGWTCLSVIADQQLQLFMATILLVMGMSSLAPWEIGWQAALTAAGVLSCMVSASIVRPAIIQPAYLWLYLLTASALVIASNRLWTRWYAAVRKSDRRLRSSEERLRAVLDANLDPTSVVRLSDGRYAYVNAEFLKRGYTREEVLGRSVREAGMWVDERTDLGEFAERIRTQGSVRNQEVNLRMCDGRVVPHLISSVLVELDGQPYVLSVARDIAELKQAESELKNTVAELKETQLKLTAEIEQRGRIIAEREKAEAMLQESEANLRKVFEASPDIISIFNLVSNRVTDINGAFSATGFAAKTALSWRPGERTLFADMGQWEKLWRTLAENGSARNFEAGFRTKDGTIVPYLVSAVLAEIRGDLCVISFSRDISRIKKTEGELIAAREAALAASRSKSEFLSSMSHEIRTPMNAILGMAELLGESPLTPEQRRYVETMTSNGNALLDLINGILDLAKVESGRLHLEETEFDLDELVERAVETLSVRAHEKGLELLTSISPDVPLRLVGDPLRLRQVLINLVGNAIKFTEHGEVVVAVERCDTCSNGEPLRFSVRDTGIGIPPEKLNDIFLSFTQADSSVTRRYGGSGLGLAIARRLVELMGGQIGVESKVGSGSIFSFTARLKPGAAPRTALAEPRNLADLRLLLVDDNAASRSILCQFLSSRGAEVDQAPDGKQALAQVERARGANRPYQLVLLDCAMPQMDGFQLVERLKRQGDGGQKILMMLTAENLSPKLLRLREMGLGFYVVKPVKCSELMQVIGAATGKPRLTYRKPPASDSEGDADRRPLRILLAEDSPDNRMLIEAYLKNLPYQLEAAENGELALETFKRGDYDLVLMDMQMPVMDGYTATRGIRRWEHEQNRPPAPIVALTASALEEDVRNTLEAGCTAHLSKPVKKARLLALIRDLMSAASTPARGEEPLPAADIAADQKTL